jgi:hypothetical protein
MIGGAIVIKQVDRDKSAHKYWEHLDSPLESQFQAYNYTHTIKGRLTLSLFDKLCIRMIVIKT